MATFPSPQAAVIAASSSGGTAPLATSESTTLVVDTSLADQVKGTLVENVSFV